MLPKGHTQIVKRLLRTETASEALCLSIPRYSELFFGVSVSLSRHSSSMSEHHIPLCWLCVNIICRLKVTHVNYSAGARSLWLLDRRASENSDTAKDA